MLFRPSLVEQCMCTNSCTDWYVHKYVSDPLMVIHHSFICNRLYLQKVECDVSFQHFTDEDYDYDYDYHHRRHHRHRNHHPHHHHC